MNSARIEALSDGIFAIVMTLLVLELRVDPHTFLFWDDLVALWPKLLAFLVSFIVLAIYWTSHHIQFTFIKRSNFNYTWWNIVFLLFVSLVPFSAALLGEYPLEQPAQVVYAANLIFCAGVLYSSWHYARRKDLAENERISEELIRNARHKMLLPVVFYILAILASFGNAGLSLFFLALGPVIYFIPVGSRLWDIVTNPFHLG